MIAAELPPGFGLARGVFSDVSLEAVLEAVAWRQETISMFGKRHDVPRETAWYGTEAYVYSGIAHAPAELPPVLDDVLGRLTGRGTFVDADTATFNSVLCNHYRTGSDSVAWHADDEPELGAEPLIASVSLGAARKFKIRRNADRATWTVELRHGDLLIMAGRSQADYQHAIPKVARAGARVNLTFRHVRA